VETRRVVRCRGIFSRLPAHRWRWDCRPYHSQAYPPSPERGFLVIVSVRSCVNLWKPSLRIVGVHAKIETKHLMRKCVEFHYTSLLDTRLFLLFPEGTMETVTFKSIFFFANFLSTILFNDLDIYSLGILDHYHKIWLCGTTYIHTPKGIHNWDPNLPMTQGLVASITDYCEATLIPNGYCTVCFPCTR
jgi:hypothetical protein